jgi:hypothetical protein
MKTKINTGVGTVSATFTISIFEMMLLANVVADINKAMSAWNEATNNPKAMLSSRDTMKSLVPLLQDLTNFVLNITQDTPSVASVSRDLFTPHSVEELTRGE